MGGARRFSVSTPDWGQAHLSLDAIVAYVDDELSAGAHTRAEEHLAGCAECAAEIVAQRQARSALRTADVPRLPSSLLRTLQAIPADAELPPPPPGLSVTPDGQFVLLRDVPSDDGGDAGSGRHGAPRLSRRARLGALSGLAVGALAVGALVAPGAPVPSAGEVSRASVPQSAVPARAVLGGPVLDISGSGARGPDAPAQAGRRAAPSDPPGVPAARSAPEATPVLVVESVWRDAAVK
jgi:anti-sigma factor RsiW